MVLPYQGPTKTADLNCHLDLLPYQGPTKMVDLNCHLDLLLYHGPTKTADLNCHLDLHLHETLHCVGHEHMTRVHGCSLIRLFVNPVVSDHAAWPDC